MATTMARDEPAAPMVAAGGWQASGGQTTFVVVARDYYQTLGVDRAATDDAIKRAYRKLARELHPDVTGDDPRATERFKAVTEAYEVLSDPQRRRSYDMFGTRDAPPPAGPGFPPLDLDGLLDKVFPGRRRTPRPEPGRDVEKTLKISFAESYLGVTRPLGDGLKVVVPAGIDDGARLRLKGKGEHGVHDGPDGDLYVVVLVDDDPRFRREGLDLHVDVPVPLSTVLLGGTVAIPLPALAGAAADVLTLTVPAATQGGQVFRLRGRGFARPGNRGSERGDLLATLQVRIPRVDDEERAGVEALLRRLEGAKERER
jgi:curved DNA-binding protein